MPSPKRHISAANELYSSEAESSAMPDGYRVSSCFHEAAMGFSLPRRSANSASRRTQRERQTPDGTVANTDEMQQLELNLGDEADE